MSKLQLWFHVNAVLFCKSWNVVKSWEWLARPPPGAQRSQGSSPILSKVLQILHSQQAVTPSHSQSEQSPGRLEAGSEACTALSLKPKTRLLHFPNKWATRTWEKCALDTQELGWDKWCFGVQGMCSDFFRTAPKRGGHYEWQTRIFHTHVHISIHTQSTHMYACTHTCVHPCTHMYTTCQH